MTFFNNVINLQKKIRDYLAKPNSNSLLSENCKQETIVARSNTYEWTVIIMGNQLLGPTQRKIHRLTNSSQIVVLRTQNNIQSLM